MLDLERVMENQFQNSLEELLKKPYDVIDILPQRVPQNASGSFFDVEYYLLNSEKRLEMKNRYVNVILKMMCYYHAAILWNGWNDQPMPKDIDSAVGEIMENHSGTLHILFPNENVLLVFEWDCLNMTAYNMPETMRKLVEKIAWSEGMFCWKGDDQCQTI